MLKMQNKCKNDEAPSYLADVLDWLLETSTQIRWNIETNLRVPFLLTTYGQK